jgi:hypothetical protein
LPHHGIAVYQIAQQCSSLRHSSAVCYVTAVQFATSQQCSLTSQQCNLTSQQCSLPRRSSAVCRIAAVQFASSQQCSLPRRSSGPHTTVSPATTH